MNRSNDNRSKLPSVEQILQTPSIRALIKAWGRSTIAEVVRELQRIQRDLPEIEIWATISEEYESKIEEWAKEHLGHGYTTVFNLTGTVIHTNLGRSLISTEIMARATEAATRPTTLEYDLKKGKRGNRESSVERRLKLLTGCEAATVVNNNAAAVLLVLNTLSEGKNVLVSRGELVEIGGSFRLPDIMSRANCQLSEVGTTNRTRASDYESAINRIGKEAIGILLKVHPSNYHITGFTESTNLKDLAPIANENRIPLTVDIGSGAIVDLSRYGLPHEPTISETLDQGADLITFSGDKLLGSIQAGIIVGTKELVDLVKQNPLKRALRADKITLSILDETLKLYEDPENLTSHIPLLKTLTLPKRSLDHRAKTVLKSLTDHLDGFQIQITDSQSQIGSGALPDQLLPSQAVTISHNKSKNIRRLDKYFRSLRPAIVGRIHNDQLWLDMRCADPLDELIETFHSLSDYS